MTLEERLARLDNRQEHMIGAIHGLADVMEQTRDLVAELMEWLQQPQENDLADAIKALVLAIDEQSEVLGTINDAVIALPVAVARHVKPHVS